MQEIPTMQQPPPSQMYPPSTYPPPQQPVLPPKKKMSTGMKWLIAAVVILALGLVGGLSYAVGRSGSSVQPAPTPTPQVTPKPSAEDIYKSGAQTMTIAEIVQSGDSSKNAIVHFQGMVAMTATNVSGYSGAVIVDPSNSNYFVIVALPTGTDLNKIAVGDTIEIWGQHAGVLHVESEEATGVMVKYFTDHTSGYATP